MAPGTANNFSWGFLIISCSICITIPAISAIIFSIVWLVEQPQIPVFRVDSFSISNFTVRNGSRVSSFAADVRLTARNPNKKLSLSFPSANADIYYGPWSLGRTVMPPFWLHTKSQIQLTASFAAVGIFVERDSVGLDLKITYNEKKIEGRSLNVFCGDLFVGIPSDGRPGRGLTDGPSPCRIEDASE